MLNIISKIIVITIILNKYHSDYKLKSYISFIHCYTQPNTIYQYTSLNPCEKFNSSNESDLRVYFM